VTGLPATAAESTGSRPLPAVTVVIPTRDRPALLRSAVEAVLAQDYAGELRCVVVHDGTEPDRALERDTVTVTRNVRSPGLAGARNSGIALAETELVAFCDDDDRWLPGKLSRQVEVFRSDPQARFVGCGIQVRCGERVVERTLPMDRVTFADLLRDRLTELHPSTFLIQRSLLDEIGLVDEALPGSYAEDYELLLRAARVAPVRSLPAVLVEVLWHPKSYFTGRWATVSAALQRLLATYPDFYRERAGAARLSGHSPLGAQIFPFGRHINLQRGGERFPGKSRSGTSKAPTPALAGSSLWAMARDPRPANGAFFPDHCP
jgi:glycosyltransferase involved in cell wall biosynthesis